MDDENLKEKVDRLERELAEYKRDRFANLSMNDVETLKGYIFERTAATLASGASLNRYAILTLNGVRAAIPTYDKFTPII